MGKISKKGNKDLLVVIDKIKALLNVDATHGLYERIKEAVLSDNINDILTQYTEIIKEDPERDWIQNMFMFSGADSAGLGQDYTPAALSKIMAAVSDYDEAETVLDVCCGTGSLTLQLHNKHPCLHFTMLEIDSRVISLLLFNMALNNVYADILHMDVVNNNVFEVYEVRPGERFGRVTKRENNEYELGKFDIVISNPPFNLKIEDYNSDLLQRKSKDGNVLFMDFCIQHIKEDGRGGIILMASALSKDGDEADAREALLNKKMLTGALTLTTNLFESTNIGTCMFCLGYAEAPVLVDCTKKTTKDGKKFTYTDDQVKEIASYINEHKISEAKNSDEFIEGTVFAAIPSIEEIERQKYNLTASSYMIRNIMPTEEDFKNTVREYLKFRVGQILEGRG